MPFLVGLSFYGIFWNLLVIGEYNIKILATKFSLLFLLHSYNQVAKIVTFISDYSVYSKMPCLIRIEKVSCEHCGTQVTRNKIERHKKRCSAITL